MSRQRAHPTFKIAEADGIGRYSPRERHVVGRIGLPAIDAAIDNDDGRLIWGSPRSMLNGAAMSKLRLIYLHVPKAGGTTLRNVITDFFGADRIYVDNDGIAHPDTPLYTDPVTYREWFAANRGELIRNKQAVIGHFTINKYRDVHSDVRATILRDPIDRALSHYYFWMASKPSDHPLHQYQLSSGMGIWEWLATPLISNFYTDVYFDGVDMAQFDVVFRYEHLAGQWAAAMTSLGLTPHPQQLRINETKAIDTAYAVKAAEFRADAAAMARARDLLRRDIDFYERYAR